MLEKNRHRRSNLETILNMEWFSSYSEAREARRDASPEQKFKAFTLTSTSGEEVAAEVKRVQATSVKEEEKKE